MANDCLVTKLKGTVNNNNFLRLGEFIIHVIATSSGQDREFTWIAGQAGYVRTLDGSNKIKFISSAGAFTNYVEIPAGKGDHTIIFDSGEYDIVIGNMYNIRTCNPYAEGGLAFSADLNRLAEYSQNLFEIGAPSNSGKTALYLNLDNFAKNTGTSLGIVNNLDGPGFIIGSIESLADKPNLIRLFVNNSTGVTGSIEKLVEAHIKVLGRTSGYLWLELGKTSATLNNITALSLNRSTFYVKFSDTGCTIGDSYNSSSTIFATYNKSTNVWTYDI